MLLNPVQIILKDTEVEKSSADKTLTSFFGGAEFLQDKCTQSS